MKSASSRSTTHTTQQSESSPPHRNNANNNNNNNTVHFTRRKLTEEQFRDPSFVLKDLLEGISRRLVFDMTREEQKTGEVGFETEPFRVSFEAALAELRVLDGVFDKQVDEALERCIRAEEEFQARMAQLLQGQQDCQTQLEAMDRRMAESTTSAVGVGERLQSASVQRESVEAALEVMSYFEELNQGRATSAVFVDPERIHEREVVLKNLRAITQGLPENARTAVGVAGVETQCRQLVKQLMERFRVSVRKNDVRSMEVFAASLFDFDGGESCVEAYLEEAFAPAAHLLKKWKAVGDSVTVEVASAMIRKFFVTTTAMVDQEFGTMEAVFIEPAAVLTTVLEKIFEWSERAEHDPFPLSLKALLDCISTATTNSAPETFLVALGECYDRARQLVDHLSSFTLESGVDLSRLMDFVWSASRDAYLERELALQENLYAARLASFRGLLSPTWIQQERAAKSSHFPWESVGGGGALLDTTYQMSLDDVELTKFFLQQNRAALERCSKLSHRKDAAANVTAVYKLLLRTLGHSSVSTAVSLHLEMLPDKPNLKRPLDVSFLYVTLAVNTFMLDLEQFHHGVVLPKVAGSINEPTKCNSMKDKLVNVLEQKLSTGLQKLVHVMVQQVEALLSSKQKRNDFRLSEGDGFATRPTEACRAVCEFLNTQLLAITSCLDGGNADVFLRLLGTLIYESLFAHMKRVSVSMGMGGAQLMLDLSHYVDTVKRFKLSVVGTRFEILRSLAKLHMVEEGNLRTLVKELLVTVPRDTLIQYLPTHENFKNTWLDEYL